MSRKRTDLWCVLERRRSRRLSANRVSGWSEKTIGGQYGLAPRAAMCEVCAGSAVRGSVRRGAVELRLGERHARSVDLVRARGPAWWATRYIEADPGAGEGGADIAGRGGGIGGVYRVAAIGPEVNRREWRVVGGGGRVCGRGRARRDGHKRTRTMGHRAAEDDKDCTHSSEPGLQLSRSGQRTPSLSSSP